MELEKYRNHVYLTICEFSLNDFNKTNFTTYSNYCMVMNSSLKDGNLSRRERKNIVNLVGIINSIYCMGEKETMEYIVDYFSSNRCCDFEKVVIMMKKCFPYSSNI